MFLLRHTLQVKSFGEFKRKFYAFLEMMLRQEPIGTLDENFVAYPEDMGKLCFYNQNFKKNKP